MKKRANGEGSISRRADGKFMARISSEGKRLCKYFSLRKDANAWLAAQLSKVADGGCIFPSKVSFAELAEEWKAAKRHSVGANTFVKYEANYRNHLLPELGDLVARDAAARLQSLINKKAAVVSPATVRQIVLVARQVLELAVDRDILAKIPRLTLPKMAERVPAMMTSEQLLFLLEAANADRYGHGLWIEVGAGLRRSELLALDWTDFNEAERTISVTKAVIRHAGKYQVKETKTKAGIRKIDLPAVVVTALKRSSLQQGRMFATESGDYLSPWSWQRAFTGWKKAANAAIAARNESAGEAQQVPPIEGVRFHDLRHLYATNLLAAGIAPRVTQTMTGHENMTTLQQRYTHVLPEQTRSAADKLGEMLPQNLN